MFQGQESSPGPDLLVGLWWPLFVVLGLVLSGGNTEMVAGSYLAEKGKCGMSPGGLRKAVPGQSFVWQGFATFLNVMHNSHCTSMTLAETI